MIKQAIGYIAYYLNSQRMMRRYASEASCASDSGAENGSRSWKEDQRKSINQKHMRSV
jgi:hypothetical protein